MSETIPGGFYRKPDGTFKDAKGKPIKLTVEIRKQLADVGIKIPSKPKAKKQGNPETPETPEDAPMAEK